MNSAINSLSGRCKALCTALAVCALAACAGPGLEQAVGNGSYLLVEKQAIALTRSVTLRYDALIDSRCPKGVICIWAGRISYRFTLSGRNGAETFQLAAIGDSFTSSKLKGVRVVLARTEVPTAPPAAHAVTVDVIPANSKVLKPGSEHH